MNKYIKDICWVFLGFYLFAILFSVVDSGKKNLIDTLNLLGPLISSGGAIAAIFAVIQIAHHRTLDKQYNSSLLLINTIRSYLKHANNCLLDDGLKPKNNRSEWIRAAKLIISCGELESKIRKTAHLYDLPELIIQLDSLLDEYRFILCRAICIREGNRISSLPASFFCGVDDWENKSFDDARNEANSRNFYCSDYNPKEVTPPFGSTELEERSVFVVAYFMLGKIFNEPFDTIVKSQYSDIPDFFQYEGMAIYLRNS